jgi:hypothetical protein
MDLRQKKELDALALHAAQLAARCVASMYRPHYLLQVVSKSSVGAHTAACELPHDTRTPTQQRLRQIDARAAREATPLKLIPR